ncbi:IPT/TIG domain-containing protein [Burkholderia vietnamiensis]|uniref:IPT/TIG domain-containing protein n=1 Tax=Burkholderia vietnamiensis TaxID=60552 RepID=UPI0020113BC0
MYNYDPLGNIVSIARGNGVVSIVSFSPQSGPVGANVTISGNGFSATASQNAVAFNGTAATVVSATSNQLVVSVPAGATTGPISVTSPAGSATSTSAFSVVSGQAPTITGFSPTIGGSGATVSISGTNFKTTIVDDSLVLNIRGARVAIASATTISATVPPSSTSGRFAITTPYGQATSSQDFFVPPGAHVPGDVGVTGRMLIGGSQSVALGASNKIGMILFDGTAGQRVILQVTSSSFGSCDGGTIQILNADGTVAGGANLCNGAFVDAVTLPVTATYTILVTPYQYNTNATGSVTFSLNNVPPDVTGTITAGGPSVALGITTPGQNGSLTFSGTAARRVSLYMARNSGSGCWRITINNPDGSSLLNYSDCTGTYFSDVLTLPATGTYTIKFDPQSTSTQTATFTLYSVPPDLTGTITVDEPAVTLAITAPGQNGSLTFNGTASQRVALYMARTSGSGFWRITIVNPDGSTLTTDYDAIGTYFSDVLTLPATGTYTIKFDPDSTSTPTATFTLSTVPPDVTGTITAGGSSITLTTTAAGQNGILTFGGTASQRVSVYMAPHSGGGCGRVSVIKPDGSYLIFSSYCAAAWFSDVLTLPVAGTYTIKLDPESTSIQSATFTLYSVPPDATGTITVGGSAVTLTNTVPGQNGNLVFSGTASQSVSLNMSLDSGLGNGCWIVRIVNPDGTYLLNQFSCNSPNRTFGPVTLPTTGTYSIIFDPSDINTGTATFTLVGN